MYKNVLDSYVHGCTIMYMKIAEFRSNLKTAFDEALKGNAVIIERGGVIYKLVADVTTYINNLSPGEPLPQKEVSETKPVPRSGLENQDNWQGPLFRNQKKRKL